jgi:hypothetical protein
MKKVLVFIIFLSPFAVSGQSSYAPLNEEYYHKIDRYEIKTGRLRSEFFTSVKPYKRSEIVAFTDSVDQLGVFKSKADQFNFEYLHNDSWEWGNPESSNSRKPILRHFYKKKSDLFSVNNDDFDLHVNPVLYLGAGKDSRVDDPIFINTRGVEVRGMIDKKIGFYSYLTDNQALLPAYVDDRLRRELVLPHQGFWKNYKEGRGVDFLQARGYITFQATKHVTIQAGQDRTFIGNGYRSLIFSDYAPPSLFFRANVKVWKINYMYQLNRMTADVTGNTSGLTGSKRYPEKYLAFHHLSINIGKKLNVGLFESVVFSPRDSTNRKGSFDWSYANPIIFFRAVEQQSGSPDNVLIGMDFKWNVFRKVSIYGQFVLDEFVLADFKAGNGWWGNKYAIQGGFKYIDVLGIPNLDIQGEVNVARPFIYSHDTQYGSYSSYRQPLAHPLGANFNEMVGILRYQPLPRLNVTAKLILSTAGRDSSATSKNYGGNILRGNKDQRQNYGNTIAQGFKNDIMFGSLILSYQFKHNLFIDANIIIRQSKCPLAAYNNNSTITSLALRWNIPQRLYEF